MYFNKIHHPSNFTFASAYTHASQALTVGKRNCRFEATHLGEEVWKVAVLHEQWPAQHSQAVLSETFDAGRQDTALTLDRRGRLVFGTREGRILLASDDTHGFGLSGKAWLFKWHYDANMQFYGMGEKTFGFEHTGKRTKFWNTDVWADFHWDQFIHGAPDPMYVSIPYLIIKQGNTFIGVLVHNPFAVFMATNPNLLIAQQNAAEDQPEAEFYMGAPDGAPELYFIHGPSLDELTRKLQRLCGATPRPPLWALGYQQCRWGYRSHSDLEELDRRFEADAIPCDGLWLDIDYMRGFRVFTFENDHFPEPQKNIQTLTERGRHVVPIIDPGVKIDPAYAVYQRGLKAKAYCLNPEGRPFVGFVWPGATVFPDFSLPSARAWWADEVAAFAASGISGAWLDMNDPSTGASENSEMLFQHGAWPHAAYHNQYALGMAMATREGFLKANPDKRPFLISRSGYISTSRYCALWTGDNFSNEHHLRGSIPLSLNLALSGIPFNGPDVPGFGGDATPELAAAWHKAGFLFPFFRNHAAIGTRLQEPWQFGQKTMRLIRHYIRLRYSLLPYLYNCFIEQEATGAAIMRPMFYEFADTKTLPLSHVDDQFFMGPSLLHAPILSVTECERDVVLPKGYWFDTRNGKWIKGGCRRRIRCTENETPLFIRDGSLIPTLQGVPKDNHTDLSRIELHLFVSPQFKGRATAHYRFDEGEGFAYRQDKETSMTFTCRRKGHEYSIDVSDIHNGYMACNVRFVTYGAHGSVVCKQIAKAPLKTRQTSRTWTGEAIPAGFSAPCVFGKPEP
ncbi:MAG: hypothetical protein EOM20_08245 [Spartobacteria bacterium]|nr:hypothetical protein [Spartobacteria bacterium]